MTPILLLLVLAAAAFAQPQPDTLWTRINASDTISIQAIDCAVNANGDVFVTGTTYNSANGRGTGYIQKRMSNGDELWTTYTNADDQELFYSVQPADDGGCVGAGTKYTEGLPYQAFAAKYSASGQREWITYIDTPPDPVVATGYPLIAAAPGGYYLGINGTDSTFFEGYTAAARLNANGELLWSTYLDLPGLDKQVRYSRTVNGELHLAVQGLAGDLLAAVLFVRVDSNGTIIAAHEYNYPNNGIYGFESDTDNGAAFLLRDYNSQTELFANQFLQVSTDGVDLGRTVLPWPVNTDSVSYYFGDLCRTPSGGYAASGARSVPLGAGNYDIHYCIVGISVSAEPLWLRKLAPVFDPVTEVINNSIALSPDSSFVMAADRGYSFFPLSSTVVKTGPDLGSGRISGVVRNSRTFEGVFAATVSTSDGALSTTTLPSGDYDLRLPAGMHDLVVEKNGYCQTLVDNIEIINEEDQLLDVNLDSPSFLCNATSVNLQWNGEPVDRTVIIANANGNCPLELQVDEDIAWLSVTPESAVIAPDGNLELTLTVATPPPPGEYTATVHIRHNADGLEYELDVLLSVPLSADNATALPQTTELHPAYPNPFNASTQISFALAHAAPTSLVIYDIQGRAVQTLVDQMLSAGLHTREFQPTASASGVFFAVLKAGDAYSVQKLLLLK